MANVLIVPERNEGQRPLRVVEAGLQSSAVDRVFVVDGWSTDGSDDLLTRKLPALSQRYHKEATLVHSRLRNTGKGGAMVTGMQLALEGGYDTVSFVDADISSLSSAWFDALHEGLDRYGADMSRGYFDRSPLDAQITRHITLPGIHLFFPEGQGIRQPLGGELCLRAELARALLEGPLAPPHTWGIDTFLVVTSLVGGFRLVELYLSQKLHNPKTLEDLEGMLLECFDELARLVHFHGRHLAWPSEWEPQVTTVPPAESRVERIGEDVRTLAYTNRDAEVAGLFRFAHKRAVDLGDLERFEVAAEDQALLARLLENPGVFRRESKALGPERWVRILDALIRSHIAHGFGSRHRDLLFLLWRMRTLAFYLHEAMDFESAEAATRRQAERAFDFGRALRGG